MEFIVFLIKVLHNKISIYAIFKESGTCNEISYLRNRLRQSLLKKRL